MYPTASKPRTLSFSTLTWINSLAIEEPCTARMLSWVVAFAWVVTPAEISPCYHKPSPTNDPPFCMRSQCLQNVQHIEKQHPISGYILHLYFEMPLTWKVYCRRGPQPKVNSIQQIRTVIWVPTLPAVGFGSAEAPVFPGASCPSEYCAQPSTRQPIDLPPGIIIIFRLGGHSQMGYMTYTCQCLPPESITHNNL